MEQTFTTKNKAKSEYESVLATMSRNNWKQPKEHNEKEPALRFLFLDLRGLDEDDSKRVLGTRVSETIQRLQRFLSITSPHVILLVGNTDKETELVMAYRAISATPPDFLMLFNEDQETLGKRVEVFLKSRKTTGYCVLTGRSETKTGKIENLIRCDETGLTEQKMWQAMKLIKN